MSLLNSSPQLLSRHWDEKCTVSAPEEAALGEGTSLCSCSNLYCWLQFVRNLSLCHSLHFSVFPLYYKTSTAVFPWPEDNVQLECRALSYKKKKSLSLFFTTLVEKILQKATKLVQYVCIFSFCYSWAKCLCATTTWDVSQSIGFSDVFQF